MSRTFATNWGSSESLYDFDTCGFSPNVRQIRPIDEWLSPLLSAILRVLQCVRPFGFVSSVFTTTAST